MSYEYKNALVHNFVDHKFVYQPPRRICKSSIARIKAALQDKEMIDFDRDSIYLEDPVFKIWYKRK
jgi:hypothetical protein